LDRSTEDGEEEDKLMIWLGTIASIDSGELELFLESGWFIPSPPSTDMRGQALRIFLADDIMMQDTKMYFQVDGRYILAIYLAT
jgi:hypothetical protein